MREVFGPANNIQIVFALKLQSLLQKSVVIMKNS